MDKQEVIENLKKLASQNKTKKYLIGEDLKKIPKLYYYTTFHYRTLANALKLAGLTSSKLAVSMNISNENLLNYLKDLYKELGETPTVWHIQHDKKYYKKYSDEKIVWSLFKSRFGGLTKAREHASIKDNTPLVKEKKIVLDNKDDEENLPKNRFWGEAAELHVLAELLYRKFQAANIPVDVGLDILAIKNNKTYYFQVKHKDLSNNQAIKITKSSFEKTGSGEVYYIFVLLTDKKRDFLIIPYHIINDWIRQKIVEDSDDCYLIYIKHTKLITDNYIIYEKYIKNKNKQYVVKGRTLENYLNNWDVIR